MMLQLYRQGRTFNKSCKAVTKNKWKVISRVLLKKSKKKALSPMIYSKMCLKILIN